MPICYIMYWMFLFSHCISYLMYVLYWNTRFNNIRGAFIHFSFWAHYCAQRQNIKEYKRTIYFQNVQTGCIFYWSPPKKVPSFVEWMIKSLQKVKIRVKTSHLIFRYVHFHFIGWDFATFNTKTF